MNTVGMHHEKIKWSRARVACALLPVVLVCAIAAAVARGWPHDRFVRYVPCLRYFDHGVPVIVDEPELESPALGRAVAEWLRPGEYEFREGKLYVNHSVARDREMLMNYTLKAKSKIERDAAGQREGGT